jgi:hypothetical protein
MTVDVVFDDERLVGVEIRNAAWETFKAPFIYRRVD